MDIVEISPLKKLSFTVPSDLHRVLTVTNLTLRSVAIMIIPSHDKEISLSANRFIMEAFQEIRIDIMIVWAQQAMNLSAGKLRMYIWQLEDEMEFDVTFTKMFEDKERLLHEDITIDIHLDDKNTQILHYRRIKQEDSIRLQESSSTIGKKYYMMRRVLPFKEDPVLRSAQLRDKVYQYLQNLTSVISIEPSSGEECYLLQFSNDLSEQICQFYSVWVKNVIVVYVMSRIIGYGDCLSVPNLINIDSNDDKEKEMNPNICTNISKKTIQKDQILPPDQIQPQTFVRSPAAIKKAKETVKQSFILKPQKVKGKRKNKSEEKIIQNSEDEDEDEDKHNQLKQQMREFRLAQNFNLKSIEVTKKRQVLIKQKVLEMNNRVLNLYIDKRQNQTRVYVLLRDCIKMLVLEDQSIKKTIKFDAIDEQNVKMPSPIDMYKGEELIFGNQSYLFWVNVETGMTEWKYVQRKYIYALAVIDELSLVTIGGKNFSKLSYFGKETSRSNIKLYSCSSSDKHDHLFTYDFPGNNVGNVSSLCYITVPPQNTKLLLAHTLSTQGNSCIYFLRIKAFNKIEVYGQIDSDELGILKLLKIKYNKESERIVCMQALGETEMDAFKRLKIRCQYQKVDVTTEGFKFIPLRRYISYWIGGECKNEQNREWISVVEEDGKTAHVLNIEENKCQSIEVGKGEARLVLSINNGKYLLICSDTVLKIRERYQKQV